MKITKFFIITLVLSLLCSNLMAQNEKVKFGKVDIEDLKMEYYELDSTASAVVLYEKAIAYFIDYKYCYEVHRRIKVFDKDKFRLGDVNIWHYESPYEFVMGVKGVTYSLEDGKIKKTKLLKKDIYVKEYSGSLRSTHFTMPNIEDGCIIEYTYKIESLSYSNYRTWDVQKFIPVKYSECKFSHPIVFKIRKTPTNSSLIHQTKIIGDVHRYIYKDVPAFVREPKMSNYRNYIGKIEFELIGISLDIGYGFGNSWLKLNNMLLESENFGSQLELPFKIKKDIEKNISDTLTEFQKMKVIFEYIKETMTWNGGRSVDCYTDISSAYNKKTGNCADINLMLIAALRKFDIDAKPVVLSSRKYKPISIIYPSLSSLDYVIAKVQIDSTTYYLDATEKFCPINLLPERTLNELGMVVEEDNADFVNILPTEKYKKIIETELTLDTENGFSGHIKSTHMGYAAFEERMKIDSALSIDVFFEDYQKNLSGLFFKDYNVINQNDIYEPLIFEMDVDIDNFYTVADSMLYISPCLFYGLEENPFKLDERKYLIDLKYPQEIIFKFKFTIPKGYKLVSLPENMNLKMENSKTSFLYSGVCLNEMIQIVSRINFVDFKFPVEEYSIIKYFFSYIVDKHNEQIVQKKI